MKAIEIKTSKSSRYEEMSKKAMEHARSFDINRQYTRLLKMLET